MILSEKRVLRLLFLLGIATHFSLPAAGSLPEGMEQRLASLLGEDDVSSESTDEAMEGMVASLLTEDDDARESKDADCNGLCPQNVA